MLKADAAVEKSKAVSSDEKTMATAMRIASLVIVSYWIVWFAAPSLVAPSSDRVYVQFEHAFPAADLVLAVGLFMCSRLLTQGRRGAPLWAAFVVGGGTFLFLMDVTFALEHGLYTKGAGGVIELLVNCATGTGSALVARWLRGSRP